MYLRVIVAIAVVAGLTAFSPAPFPKNERKKTPDDIVLLQGTYKVIDYGRPNLNGGGARLAIRRSEMKVQISGNKWSFMYSNGNGFAPSTTYEMKLMPKTAPKMVDMTYNVANDYTLTMKGIYKIEGKKVTMAYVTSYSGARFGGVQGEVERPTSFENLSGNAMLITMERE
jgi:uncharacterized protein (TIGR03067 family)